MSYYSSRNSIWAGLRRAKVTYNIAEAQSRDVHVDKAAKGPCHLPGRIPETVEITEKLNFPDVDTGEFIRAERRNQLLLLDALSADMVPLQTVWSNATPPEIRLAAGGVMPAIIPHILSQIGKWVKTDPAICARFRRHRGFPTGRPLAG